MSAQSRLPGPFTDLTREWFRVTFAAPTPAQIGAWDAIPKGDDVLVVAPTGSGKTLAAFLWALDRLSVGGDEFAVTPDTVRGRASGKGAIGEKRTTRVLYVSPLKALAVDIERNLRSPLAGLRAAASRLGVPAPDIEVAVRTGDTPADERRRFASRPADILITTPESLFLLLTSQARSALEGIETVIVDEVHSVAGTKRGSHLMLSLERLDELLPKRAQRIGLSATVRPLDEVARFLGGTKAAQIVDARGDKKFELSIVVPVEDMAEPGVTEDVAPSPAAGASTGGKRRAPDPSLEIEERRSIWPHVEARLLELIRAHKSTIVFVNSRRLSERLCARLNELAQEEVARSHHGSVSREQRLQTEEELKRGLLPAVVATSSLELGIDMGEVDLVVQVEAPPSVASGLQRIGRAGHQVGETSKGIIFPKYRGDLVPCAVVAERVRAGAIEALHFPRNPLDVLAQQIVAMVAMDEWNVDELEILVRRSAPFAELPREALESVLDMLSGRYPSDEFAELRPRVNWDRATGRLGARPGAQRLAVTSGGTIPDRGLFGVFLAGEERGRVGELDEEMVYESRPGEVFLLGASSWLIEDITHDRVLVTPAPGRAGKTPFWHGDAPGRQAELGRALGSFVRELTSQSEEDARTRLSDNGLDELAADNLLRYLDEQREATGVLPDDRTIVVERFRDELGDWRVVIHSPLGARVHAPWAQAIEASLAERYGVEVRCIYTDDGIVVALPEGKDDISTDAFLFDADEVEDIVVNSVGTSSLFASRFRECAARALLLPRRRPGSRTPLWQQRQRSAHLLDVARKYASFPIILESYRECLQDVFDVPALAQLMRSIAAREVRLIDVETRQPSPFASSLQFSFVGAFMYEGDAPIAERRAQALSLDRSLLAEIMGREELRELLDAGALESVELELQRLASDRKIRDADDLHDALRYVGDLSTEELAARSLEPGSVDRYVGELHASRRAVEIRIAGDERWIALEDVARYRDALGVAPPVGVPQTFLESPEDPLLDLIGRYARTHGPFTPEDPAARFGLGRGVIGTALQRLEQQGRVVQGEFRPGGTGREWIDVEVLRRVRRRSLAALRKEVEAVPPDAFARFSLAWHGIVATRSRTTTIEDVYAVVEQLQGVPIPASALEAHVLVARVPGYSGALLDELCASGEVVWAGHGSIGARDGWVQLALADDAPLLLHPPAEEESLNPLSAALKDALERRGALFFRALVDEVSVPDDEEVLRALWELVWAGYATNDTLAPLRIHVAARSAGASRHARAPRRRPRFPARQGPPEGAGRWSLVVERESNNTRRLHAQSDQMLARYGVVTRGAVAVEDVVGGFAAVYSVLSASEEVGRCRRGYFVEGLGGSQFALPGAVDRLRSVAQDNSAGQAKVIAATDPANPYGAALPWPDDAEAHRPGRKAGAHVIMVDGRLVGYLERGAKTLLTFARGPDDLTALADALTGAVTDGLIGRIDLERADGVAITESELAPILSGGGFKQSPKGLSLRA